MTTKIELTYCGMSGSGATVKLAKQDAARKIEAALAGYYTPTVLRHGDLIGFVWREPAGYCYKILWPVIESGPTYGSGSKLDEKSVISNCARHMAQSVGHYAGTIAKYLNDADKRNLDSYFAWQERYRVAKSTGMTDQQAYDHASNRP